MSLRAFAKRASLCLAIAAGLPGPAHAAAPDIVGSWSITILMDPNLITGGTQCLVLTKTGGVGGVANSGTWMSTTFANWGGFYFVDKKNVLTLWGSFGSPTPSGFDTFVGTVSSTGLIHGRSFAEFTLAGTMLGTGSMKMNPGCAAGARTQGGAGVSPAGVRLTQ